MPDFSFLTWPFFEEHHRTLAHEARAWAKDVTATFSGLDEDRRARALARALGEAGWLRYSVPASGGGNFETLDVRTLCLLREIWSYFDGLLDCMGAMQGLGAGPISLFGTEEQQLTYLPKVAAGESIAAFALSEKAAGSDVASLSTHATRKGDSYLLNGEKTWISNAGIADFYVVFARTGEAPGAKGLSSFVVEANSPGLEVTERIETTTPHPLGTIRLKDCQVPLTALIGDSGRGFQVAMATLDVFRSTVGAAALGFARRALDEALHFSNERRLFGDKLSALQLTQAKIAEMAAAVDTSALLVYRAAWAKDSGKDRITREAAMAKMYATEQAQKVIDQAVQLHGGLGVTKGMMVEKLYQDIRPLRIYEGTSEVQGLVIARQVMKEFLDNEEGERH